MEKSILEVKGLSKYYGGQLVLNHISFSIKSGEVHAVIGENGTGKTTLMKILAGVERKDCGEIFFESKKIDINSPREAQALGIYMIFHDINLVSSLSVVENIYMRNWILFPFKYFPIINWHKQISETKKIFKMLNVDINPSAKVSTLGLAQQKMVEIAKALCRKARVLILDETTSSLNDQDSENLFKVIKRIQEIGTSVIFISHEISEVMKFADTVTILKNGQVVQTNQVKDMDLKLAVGKMAGKEFIKRYPKIKLPIGKEVMRLSGAADNKILRDISFSLRKGEILGLTGLMGSGRTAVAKAIFGLNPLAAGKIFIENEEVSIKSPIDAINKKIGFIPEDKSQGLLYNLNISQNISLSNLRSVVDHNFIDVPLEKKLAMDYVRRLGIKNNAGISQRVKYLSDGNQQKVMIAKWLLSRSKIFIFDEPTKGLDIVSKVEVYNLMNEIILNQAAILLISSDIAELIGMCDRILILHKGVISKELKGKEISETNIMYFASGGE